MAKKVEKKHNGNISLWKFVFAMLILAHHLVYIEGRHITVLFKAASIGVEFFFIVSGYLLAKKVYSEERKRTKKPIYSSTWDFIIHKIKAFYPYLIVTYIIFLIEAIVFKKVGPILFLKSLVDLTLLQQAGLPNGGLIGVSWYLSALILGMLIIYPLMKKYTKTFSCLIAPLITIFLGGFLLHGITTVNSFRSFDTWTGIMCMGLGRAIIEMCFGITIYEICEKMKKISFTKGGSIILLIAQVLAFGFVMVCNIFSNYRFLDWLYIIIMGVGILIGFSEKVFLQDKFNNKFFYYLEKLSLPVFLNNFVFINIFNESALNSLLSFPIKCILVVIATLLLSMLELLIVEKSYNLRVRFYNYVKTKIINE